MQSRFDSNEKTFPNGKKLVAYFSRSGNTRSVAETISKRLSADIEIIDNPSGGSKAIYTHDPSDYDLVIVGTPVNGFTVSKPVKKYLEKNKARFKEIAIFATYSLWSANTLRNMTLISGKKLLSSAVFKSRDIKLGKVSGKIEDFIDLIIINYLVQEPISPFQSEESTRIQN